MRHMELTLIKLNFVIFFVIMVSINYLKQEEISQLAQQYKPLIQPAGYTFSIWSLIYIWLAGWLLYSFFKSAPPAKVYASIKYWLPLNFTMNTLWVLTYTAEQFLLSCLCILLVLVTTIIIYIKLYQFKSLSWLFTGVFSIYLGWIAVASIVNLFYYVNTIIPVVWTYNEQLTYSILALIIVFLLAIYMLKTYRDKLFAITIVWSLVGIALNKASTLLSAVSISLATVISLTIIIGVFFHYKHTRSNE